MLRRLRSVASMKKASSLSLCKCFPWGVRQSWSSHSARVIAKNSQSFEYLLLHCEGRRRGVS